MHSVIFETSREGLFIYLLVDLALTFSLRIVLSTAKAVCGMLLAVDFMQCRWLSEAGRKMFAKKDQNHS